MLLKGHLWRNPLVGHKRLRGGIQPWWAPTSGSPAADGRYPTMVSTHQRVTSGWWSASDHGGYPPAADGRHPTMASIPLRAEGHPTFGPLEIRFAKTLSGLLCHPLVARRICCWRPESGWKDVCPQGWEFAAIESAPLTGVGWAPCVYSLAPSAACYELFTNVFTWRKGHVPVLLTG